MRYLNILDTLRIAADNDPAGKLATIVRDLLKKINLPTTIKDLGISEDEFKQNFEKLVKFALTDLATGINPRHTTKEDLEKIFNYAYEGKSIDF